MSKETEIIINEMKLSGTTAIRIMKCLKEYEPEIWNELKETLKQALKEANQPKQEEGAEQKEGMSKEEIELPEFLYEDDGQIKIGFNGDSVCTDEWNKYLNKTNKER